MIEEETEEEDTKIIKGRSAGNYLLFNMDKKRTNPCIRCGKERIHSKTWEEKVVSTTGYISSVSFTETVCPDPACQKIVDQKLKVERDKKKAFDKEREKRMKENKANRTNKRNSKK